MKVKPGFTGEAYPESFNIKAMPKQPLETKPGQLSKEQVKEYFEKLLFFTDDELSACKNGINQMVDALAHKLYDAGKITDIYAECGFQDRITKLEASFPGATVLFIKEAYLCPGMKSLFTNERMLNVVEQLIGPDIAGHPIWNIRPKCPPNEATNVPWHQDSGYLDTDSYDVLQVTAWIPFVDAVARNGCMQVAENGHKTGKVATHQCCHGGTWYTMLEEEEMAKTLQIDVKNDFKTCEVPYGGMLLMNNIIPHRSTPNLSDEIRWSMDLRWQTPHKPYGYYGLKQGILFRSSDNPDMKPDWDTFESIDRQQVGADAVKDMSEVPKDIDFDISIQGPWMKKWEITHVNNHVQKMYDDEKNN